MDKNEKFFTADLGKAIAKDLIQSTAVTAGIWMGVIAVALAAGRVQEYRKSKKSADQ